MKLPAVVLLFSLPLVAAGESVKTQRPVPADQAELYEVPGRTEPFESATIFTRATGIIRDRKFEIGQAVKSGEVLAVIDTPEIDRAVDAAKAAVEQARARAANAQNLSSRSSRLLRSDVVSKEETEQRQTDAAETSAAVRVAEAELARLEEQQRFSVVRAPFDGVISARNLDRGDLARGDNAPADGWIYRLARLDTLRFVVSASPDLALRLKPESTATVRFKEFPGREFSARVAQSSRLFDSATGTMRVELLLQNSDLLLPAGLTGSATFSLVPPPGTFRLPANAVFVREGKSLVALADGGAVRYVPVTPGRNLGRDLEVTSPGLTASSEVLLNPNALLREGDPVTPAKDKPVTRP
jgi:RND family efflux transporter MFP subunit